MELKDMSEARCDWEQGWGAGAAAGSCGWELWMGAVAESCGWGLSMGSVEGVGGWGLWLGAVAGSFE